MIGRLVSNNPNKAKTIDLINENKPIVVGRHPSCTVKIDDNRCSNNHCKITAEKVENE